MQAEHGMYFNNNRIPDEIYVVNFIIHVYELHYGL